MLCLTQQFQSIKRLPCLLYLAEDERNLSETSSIDCRQMLLVKNCSDETKPCNSIEVFIVARMHVVGLQGVYVIQDNKLRLLLSMSVGDQYKELAPHYLAFSCGLLRGALANLNIDATVTAALESMPAVKFNVQIRQKT